MYEPTYLPQLGNTLPASSAIRFGIERRSRFVRCDDPDADPLHIHNYLEIFFNITSEVSFLVNNRLYPVAFGDAIVSRPNDIHLCIFNRDCVHEYYVLWIDADFDAPFFAFLQEDPFSAQFSFDAGTCSTLRELLFSLTGLCEAPGHTLEKTALLLQILLLLNKNRQPTATENPLPENLQAILDDIHTNFARLHNVNDIVKTHFISPATLNRWFRKYMHASPHEYLESQKLSHAAKLLAGGATVAEACVKAGFIDCSYFIIRFRKKFGCTPLRYRQQLQ